MPPMLATGRFGEIWDRVIVQLSGFLNQLPADARDDLFAPSVEESRKVHASGGRGAAELAAGLNEDSLRTEAARLDGGDGSGGAAADDEHIGLEPAQGGGRGGGDEQAAGGKGSEGGEEISAFHDNRVG